MPSKVKIIFLGTSGQIPSAERNHTAVLLSYEGENILVDCGEGTQRQFRKANLNPCKVTRILITHWHGDHVLGLPGFLSTLALSGYNKTLHIYGPVGTKKFVEELLRVFNFRKEYKIVVEDVSGKFFECNNFYLEAEKMEHGIPCNAYSFVKKNYLRIDKKKLAKFKISTGPHLQKLKDGKDVIFNEKKFKAKDLTFEEKGAKISFVFDTKNNSKIVPFVRDADLFISEASFSDELAVQAEEHMHMTAAQVGEIAKRANVEKLILTHLSQRYEQAPNLILSEAKKNFKNTIIAKDFDVFEVD